jgi:hypothetical protein
MVRGNLGVFSGFFGILAAIVYGQLINVVQIRVMILIGVATAATGALLYLR